MKNLALFFICSCLLCCSARAAETEGIVVTIKPLHSLVSAVMGDTGEATLLLTGTASPHAFQLKPSQVQVMQQANIVFYIGGGLEPFLAKAFAGLPSQVRRVAVTQGAELTTLAFREGGAWEAHQHEERGGDAADGHDHAHHDHGNYDVHVWLDPENAIKMVKFITRELSRVYPENRNVYKANAREMVATISTLAGELEAVLAPVKDEPFIVFHDAYQYFERVYGLTGVGSITFEPDESPSPNRIREVRAKLQETGAKCVFREPQFSDRLVNTVIEGSNAHSGTLDPLGAGLDDGPGLYPKLLRKLAEDLTECLGRS